MSLVGSLFAGILIMAPAHEFFSLWTTRPYQLPSITPEEFPKVQLSEGEWGTVGAVVIFHYVIGKTMVANDLVEAVDENTIVYNVKEGDLLEEYKYFNVTIQVIAKGESTWVYWTFEYEKLNKDIRHPIEELRLVIRSTENIDEHLVRA